MVEEDEETDNMFALIEQIKRCKEEGKTLTDEQRKDKAEEIMNKLASMMDLGSDGEEGLDYGEDCD
jgi:hypothetical protein